MIDYQPLWKSLIDLDKTPNDLVCEGVISSATLAKMRKGGSVTLNIVEKICAHYDLPIEKVVAIRKD